MYFDFMKEGAISSFRFLGTLRKKYVISINVYLQTEQSIMLLIPDRRKVKSRGKISKKRYQESGYA